MNQHSNNCGRKSRIGWGLLAFTALVAWPALAHFRWFDAHWPLHGIPAFFLGLLVLVLAGAGIKLVAGAVRGGARWVISGQGVRIVLGASALAVSTVILFYSVELWRGKHAWAHVTREAKRLGESLDPESVVPAAVPADQDIARVPPLAYLEGAATIRRDAAGNRIEPDLGPLTNVLRWAWRSQSSQARLLLAPWLEERTSDLAPWLALCQRLEGTNQAAPPTDTRGMAAEILRSLEPYNGMIGQLRAHSTRPHCHPPFDYRMPLLMEPVSERVLLAFLRLLRLRAGAALTLDRADDAFQDLQLTLRLAQYVRQQPYLYYREARAHAFADGLQPLWEGMAAHRWTAVQLETLQDQLQAFRPIEDCGRVLQSVAFANAGFIESIIPTAPAEGPPWPGFNANVQENLRWVRRIYPKGWSFQDQAAIYVHWLSQSSSAAAFTNNSSGVGRQRHSARNLVRGSSDPFFPVFIVPRLVHMESEVWDYVPFTQAIADLAQVACALERSRLALEGYPETLAALVPRFLAEVPRDVMDGGPLRYRRTADQCFLLYSVGLDGRDDNGQPSPRGRDWRRNLRPELSLREKDWVWALPGPR